MTRESDATYLATPTPEQMDQFVLEARRLRAEATRNGFRWLGAAVRRIVRHAASQADSQAVRRA